MPIHGIFVFTRNEKHDKVAYSPICRVFLYPLFFVEEVCKVVPFLFGKAVLLF